MRSLVLCASLVVALAPRSLAQAPTFTVLGGSTFSASTDCGIVVVGGSGSNVYRWTPADGLVLIGGPGFSNGGTVDISRDGTTIASTTVGPDNILRASIWNGGTSWTQLPGLGGSSGTSESSSYATNGDGSMVVGLAWISGSVAHAFSWTQATGTVDLGSLVPTRSTRANDVSADGHVIVGWQDQASGMRQGAKWIGGVETLFDYVDPTQTVIPVGEALCANKDGSIITGDTVFNGDNPGWRWDASTGQVTLLPNLPAEPSSNRALPTGMKDDGTWICGANGGSPFTRKAILWINGQPVDLLAYLSSLGTTGLSSYTSLGSCTAMSRDGRVIVGFGQGPNFGMPSGGWVVVFPEATQSTVGTPYCFGDGSGTACPCGNNGATGHGCANSVDSAGGALTSEGVASVANDSLKLIGTHMHPGSSVFFQGTAPTSIAVYDGIRCAGGALIRLGIETNDVAGSSCYPKPDSSDVPVSIRGAIPTAGATRYYQVWYRDNDPAFCTADTSNFSSGYSLTWTP
jgi:probable HAF family extracellular repeat protein